jgi:hypothetical protein
MMHHQRQMDSLISSLISLWNSIWSSPFWASFVSSAAFASAILYILKIGLKTKIEEATKAEYAKQKEALKAGHAKELEAYKAELNTAAELHKNALANNSEIFKASLTRTATEHQIRFSRLHELTAGVIAKLYALLSVYVDASAAFHTLLEKRKSTAPAKILESKKQLDSAHEEFISYFKPNRIYLPAQLAKDILDWEGAINSLLNDLNVQTNPLLLAITFDDDALKNLSELMSTTKGALEQLLPALEAEFRQLLGVTTETEGK